MPITAKLVVSSEWTSDERSWVKARIEEEILRLHDQSIEIPEVTIPGTPIYDMYMNKVLHLLILRAHLKGGWSSKFLETNRSLFSEFVEMASKDASS